LGLIQGITFKKATELNLRTARLPLEEHIPVKSIKVLTTNHVFEILGKIQDGVSWKDAIVSTVPTRKQTDQSNGDQYFDDDYEDDEDEDEIDVNDHDEASEVEGIEVADTGNNLPATEDREDCTKGA
jgi:tRNA (guanine9-N1)-methyltransferase